MKVFLSWSGDLSHKLACAFRDWLPQLLNAVTPYVSSEDIDKGERWASDIAKELESSNFGIVFVTPANLAAPWINFEAGALSKTVARANVVPFLFGLKRSEVQGPLLQFQSAIFEKDDVEKLLQGVNRQLPESERRAESPLHAAFEVWWPHLNSQLQRLASAVDPTEAAPAGELRRPKAVLEEVLEIVRNQQKLLRSPEAILPPEYLESVLRRFRKRGPGADYEFGLDSANDLHGLILGLSGELETKLGGPLSSAELGALQAQVNELHDAFHRRDSSRRGSSRARDLRAANSEDGDKTSA